ncbi:MAG: T9SS type A sorting domain-containing protein [Ignavibacteria bacterium]
MLALIVFSLSSFFFHQAAYAQDNSNPKLLSPEDLKSRDNYYYTRRAGGPGLTIPENAFDNAVRQMYLLPQDKNIPNSVTSTISWVAANPIGMFYARTNNNYISGRTNSIAFQNSNPNIFYIAAAGGGVWKTTDNGGTWQVLTDNLPNIASGDIEVDQANPNVLYYGTGELNYSLDSHYGNGIYKSTNAGVSWTQVATTAVGSYIGKIVIDPTNSNIIYAAGSSVVNKSTNAGANWITTPSGASSSSLLIDPTNTQTLYVSTGGSSSGSIQKTTDGGTTWTAAITGLPASNRGRTIIAMSNVNSQILYASISNSSTSALLGVYKTTDGANTWTLQASAPNYLGGQGWYDNAICVKTGDPNTVITGGLDLYVSTNSGVTLVQKSQWASSTSGNFTHADIHYLIYNGPNLYCMSDGGVYRSTNDGNNWTDLNHYISTLQYQGGDYDPTNPLKMYGGCQDNDKESTTDGGASWIQRTTGDGGYTVVDPVNTNYVYGQYVNGSLERSANSGIGYSEIRPSGSSGGLFYNPYEMAPGDHNTIVFGRSDLWETNNAQTCSQTSGWTNIASTSVISGNVSAIGISTQTINKIYVGTSNGRILVTTDNGATWATITGYPYVTDFAVDNTNDNICYASFGGTGSTKVYKTTNGGVNWNNISNNIPSIAVNSLVLRNNAPRMLFAGTDLGVYQTTNEGTNWVSFSSGMPTTFVYDLKYKETAGIIMAATHGRGCWTFNLAQAIGIKPVSEIVTQYSLSQNYPNPFNPTTNISFSLPEETNVKLTVFDITGNRVDILADNKFERGTHVVRWEASKYSSGVYFYKLETEKFTESRKMLLVK